MSDFMDRLGAAMASGQGGQVSPSIEDEPKDDFEQLVDRYFQEGGPSENLTDESGTAKFWKGVATPTSSTQVLSRMGAVERPDEYFVVRFRDEDGNVALLNPEVKSITQEYGPNPTRETINKVDAENFQERWGHVPSEGALYVGGLFTGAVAGDPAMAMIPMGGSVKAAMAIGGVVGATDAVMREKFETGEVSLDTVLMYGAFGALGGGLLKKGGELVSDYVRSRAALGLPIEDDAIRDMLRESGAEISNVSSATQEINDALNLTPRAWLKKIDAEIKVQGKGVTRMEPEEMIEAIDGGIKSFGDKITPEQLNKLQKAKRMYEGLLNKDKPRQFSTSRLNKESGEFEYYSSAHDKRLNAAQDKYLAKMEELGKQAEDLSNYADSIVPKTHEGIVDDVALAKTGVDASDGKNATAAMASAIKEGKVKSKSSLGQAMYQEVGKIKTIEDAINVAKRAGQVSIDTFSRAVGRPAAVIKRLGSVGRELTLRMARTHADADMAFASAQRSIKGVANELGMNDKQLKQLGPQITDILNKTLDPKSADPRAAKFASTFRNIYNKAVRDAVQAGIYSEKEGKRLIESAAKDGYSPRLWDFDYLDSAEGKQKFIQMLETTPMTQKQVNTALGVMFKKSEIDAMKANLRPNKGGKFVFSKEMAQSMWARRTGLKYRPKGNFLEKARVLDLPDEVIKPFLKRDATEVLTEYVRDTYRSVSIAKHFGADGKIRDNLLKGIRDTSDAKTYEFVKEWYATEVFDPNSKALQAVRDITNKEQTAIDSIKAFQAAKLVTAQILNLGQAWVNGVIRLSGEVGMPRAAVMATKAVFSILTENGSDFAQRTGAASHIVMMQIMQEHGGNINKWVSKGLSGIGLAMVERWQRDIGANLGKAYIEKMEANVVSLLKQQASRGLSKGQEKLLKNSQNSLAELGLNPHNVGQFNVNDLAAASNLFTNEINFRVGASSIPQALQSPYGSLVRQFQTFVHAQTGFLGDSLRRAVEKNGVMGGVNMLMGIGIVPAAGAPIYIMRDNINKFISGSNDERKQGEAWLQGYVTVGALGMFADYALKAGNSGVEKAAAGLLGPTVGDIFKVTGGAVSSVKSGDSEPLIKSLIRTLPKGGSIVKRFYPEGGDTYSSIYSNQSNGR